MGVMARMTIITSIQENIGGLRHVHFFWQQTTPTLRVMLHHKPLLLLRRGVHLRTVGYVAQVRPALITRRATRHMAKNAVFWPKSTFSIVFLVFFWCFFGVFWCFLVFFGVF